MSIPLQIMESGELVTDRATVLQKWKNEFCQLLNNPPIPTGDTTAPYWYSNLISHVSSSRNTCIEWDMEVSEEEVKQAIQQQRNKKSWGQDNIPAEVLKNNISVTFFIAFFQLVLKHAAFQHSGKGAQ